jgi:hypothetical protein
MQEQHEAQMESWLDFVWDNKDSATYSIDKSTFLKISKAVGGSGKRYASQPLQFRRNGESIYFKRSEIMNMDGVSYRMLMQRYYVRLTPRGRYTTYVPVYPYYYVPLLWENWRKEYREKNNYKQGFHLKKDEAIQELKIMADFLEDQYKHEESEKREKRERKKSESKKEKRRRYYAENREDILAHQRKYREENREKINARQRKYYAENREERQAYRRKYYVDNREQLNAKNRIYQRKYREEKKEE